MAKDKIKNVFISHFNKDEDQINNLKQLLFKSGYILKNSSIDSSRKNKANNEEYIKSLLRKKLDWAGTTIVLIGPETHTRWWVDWEIEQSNRKGNRIVGVYINGGSDSDVPENFNLYGDALVGWKSDRVIDAIEGRLNNMFQPDGMPRERVWSSARSNC